MANKNIKSVANQKVITIHKEPTNKENPYATINLEALSEAVHNLQSEKGIKLYLYLAKNQNGYTTALSNSDFGEWANCGRTAYNTAVAELIEKRYLIKKDGTETIYTFFDKAREKENKEEPEENEEQPFYKPKVIEVTISPEELNNYRPTPKEPERPEKKGFVF